MGDAGAVGNAAVTAERASPAAVQVAAQPLCEICNRVVGGRLATTFRRRRLSERNKTATLVVCMPTAFAWLLLGAHAALLSCEGIALSLLRWDARIWSDIYGPTLAYAFKAPFDLREERGQVQAQRRIGLRDYLRVFTWMPHKLRMLRRHGVPSVR